MRGSNSNVNLGSNGNLQNELELLLLQQQNRSLILERERELNINRSGSAPPTVEGSLYAAGNLFRYPNSPQFDNNANSSSNHSNIGGLSEEEIRSHPAYLEYYYSHENLNPRLPPPLLSKEDWRIAQRIRPPGFGDWKNKDSIDNGGNMSLFSMQPNLSVKKGEDDLMELRKAALRNISRKNSTEFLNKSSTGSGGGSNSGMGVRRKSFADILQEGLGQPATSHLSRPASHNSLGDVYDSTRISNSRTGMTKIPPDCPIASSSGIFELADVADSLSGLNMSKGKLHAEDILKSSFQMGMSSSHHNINYADLARDNGGIRNVTNALLSERVSFPRRSSSTSNLQSQLNPSDFAILEEIKNRCTGYSANQKPDRMINSGPLLTGASEEGQKARGSDQLGIHFPHQIQYMQKMPNHGMNSPHLSPNSSQGSYYGGTPHGHEDFQALEKAYLEALLLQQIQQYESQFLQRPSGINHPYHVNRVPDSVHPKSPVFNNQESAQFPSNLRSLNGESTGSLNSQSGRNVKGRVESLLEMVKNNKAKTLELSDVFSHVPEFSMDQYGSRFIQQKLETATVEENTKIFTEIIPHALSLMTDVFGNYVIQKFFEHGTESQRNDLARNMIGHVLPLSLQMYGCRVIQKALEAVNLELQIEMVSELDGSVLKCVRDQNGNHVIQKCIECVPQERIQFIISSFGGQVVPLSTHPYGCRVIQRVLEYCDDPKTQQIVMDEIMGSVCNLAQDQYGNYVIQHILQHGKPHERSAIISKLAGQIVKLSQQKFASNVIEKCLTFGGPEERKLLVNEMLGSTDENEPLQVMMKDPFGNYVVQKVLETCDDHSRELLLSRIKVHLNTLKKYTYGKHIVSRVEKLVATGERHIGINASNSSGNDLLTNN